MNTRTVSVLVATVSVLCGWTAHAGEPRLTLFATDRPERGWVQFPAAGYSGPVCGVVYRLKDPVTNGMALGGVDTGCVDLETNGTFGYITTFNTIVPRRTTAVRTPVLALSVEGKTWALCGPPPKETYLPHLAAWWSAYVGEGQPAWANSPTSIPGWAKSVGNSRYDLPAGKTFCHTPAVLRWTSPINGEVRIDGGLWLVRNLGRIQKWELRKDGRAFTGGQIAWGPTSKSPQPFPSGNGGAAALRLLVQEGDRIELSLEKAAVDQDFVAVDLRITAVGGGKTWDVAADWSDTQNPNGPWTYDDNRTRPFHLFGPGRFPQVQFPKEIHYWGHYPVADLEYETSAPVRVGLRAWAPFIPGDLRDSMIPGIVLEAHLRNMTAETQAGTIVMDFPGPTIEEAGTDRFERGELKGDFSGVEVRAPAASYALGVVGQEQLRLGGDLGRDGKAWTSLAQSLPVPQPSQPGTSAAVGFSLPAGQEKVVRFLLTWCAPDWKAGGVPTAKATNTFTHMYAKHYPSPAQTAKLLAARHESLLKRILAWQQVIYAEKQLPVWLRDSLINNLYMITETGLWAQAKPPLGKWVRPEDGLFGMIECPRECPQIECIPCSLYGNIPVVYFFPELALSTLRGYKNYQFPDGQVPWIFGGVTCGTPPLEFAAPARPYQVASSDVCLVEMVDKMWLRSGDDALVKEFYDGCKRATIHAMNLRPEYGDKQVISMPTGDKDMEWVESVPLFGLDSHVGGIHLAQLRMAKRMAEKVGDAAFAEQCDRWFEAGSKALEEDLWTGTHYLLYHELNSGRKSAVLLSCQLDGDWLARFHGLPVVFRPDRAKTTLDTIAKASADPKRFPYGVKVFGNADGSLAQGDFGYWKNTGSFSAESFMLGMTYMYAGQGEFGEDIIRRIMDYVIPGKGYTWDFPLLWDAETGARWYGSDYYQNMMLWSVPAAMAGQDLSGPCKPGGLVDRILKAGAK